MSLEISGKVIKILQEQSGDSKNGRWVKQEFIIETEEQFPKKVCFSTWGDKTDQVKQLTAGDVVSVSFNVESREYNERWYTDLRAWKIVKSPGENTDNQQELPPINEVDIPPEEIDDDLPF